MTHTLFNERYYKQSFSLKRKIRINAKLLGSFAKLHQMQVFKIEHWAFVKHKKPESRLFKLGVYKLSVYKLGVYRWFRTKLTCAVHTKLYYGAERKDFL